jgi:hypothetical protein
MTPIDSRTAFARHTQWLALALEALVLLSLLAGALPLNLAQPVWWLRLSDAAMNLAPVLLLAVILLALGRALLYNDSSDAQTSGWRSHQLASRWVYVFALLVPLQLIGYAWLWTDSDRQLSLQLDQAERGVAELRSRILASNSEDELQRLLASANPGPLPPLQAGSLPERKQQISEAIGLNTTRLSVSLQDQRTATLRSTVPGTLRVFFGSAIVRETGLSRASLFKALSMDRRAIFSRP